MQENISLLLFARQKKTIQNAIDQGLVEFMVDCEWRGKVRRQKGADTDTSYVSFEQLYELTSIPKAKINCRINGFGPWTDEEIETAVEAGVNRLFLPMVRSVSEVEYFLEKVNNRVKPIILVETDEAVKIATDLAKLPLAGIYVGLNDLAISRGSKVIFEPLLDGTMEHLREVFDNIAFGFGGVTLLGHGHPCPVEFLLTEMHRLQCSFSFLRRSFYRDIKGTDVNNELQNIYNFWRYLDSFNQEAYTENKQLLDTRIQQLLNNHHK